MCWICIMVYRKNNLHRNTKGFTFQGYIFSSVCVSKVWWFRNIWIIMCLQVVWTLIFGFYKLLQKFFSSPELKAQVSFSDHLSSVVCLSVRLSVCLFVCKLFTLSSSTPEPLGEFEPILAQIMLGWRGFKFVQMKGPALFQGEIITK